jgi:hypothetical protein
MCVSDDLMLCISRDQKYLFRKLQTTVLTARAFMVTFYFRFASIAVIAEIFFGYCLSAADFAPWGCGKNGRSTYAPD